MNYKLLDSETYHDNKIISSIFEKNTQKIIKVTITWNKYCFRKIKTECSCLKNSFFKKCNHIKWLGYTYLNENNPKEWSFKMLEIFKERHANYNKKKGQNEECLICFDELKYDMQNIKTCIHCNYSIHTLCWNQYKETYLYYNMQKCIHCQGFSLIFN